MEKGLKKLRGKERGITLVALIITVILMLILAGVAISAVIDSEGLFSKSREATKSYENSAKDENKTISNLMNYVEIYMHEISNDGNKNDVEDEPVDENPVVKTPVTLGTLVTENQTFDGRLKGTYNNPIIPKGFAPINENGADWGTSTGYQKGLVITDGVSIDAETGNITSTGNEFVWVPISNGDDGENITFTRNNFGYHYDTTTYNDYNDPTLPVPLTTSVQNNGGFYIARYEAGNPTDGKPLSKKNVEVYNDVDYTMIKSSAEAMYPKSDIDHNVISTLVYGVHWDTTLNFIIAYGGNELYPDLLTNSTGKGNYSSGDSITSTTSPAKTGQFIQKNIYDMAGNVWERTGEEYASTKYASRGGSYSDSGSSRPISFRNYGTGGASNIGFRVVLYIEQ